MILTGPEIEKQVEEGNIDISPFKGVGPNSCDLRLHPQMAVYDFSWKRHQYGSFIGSIYEAFHSKPLDMRSENEAVHFDIPEEGIVLQPGVLYLGRTEEIIGSEHYVPIVEGRSSVGRLGMSVHVTAGFGDLGFKGSITLEITVTHPLRIYPGERICQVYFLKPEGDKKLYEGRYQGQVIPTASRMHVKL